MFAQILETIANIWMKQPLSQPYISLSIELCTGKSLNLGKISGYDISAQVPNKNEMIYASICKKSKHCPGEIQNCFFSNDIYQFELGSWEKEGVVGSRLKDGSAEYWQIAFSNAQIDPSTPIPFKMNLRCGDEKATGIHPVGLDFAVDIYHKDICGMISGGLSAGWMFLIFFLTVTTVYLVGGMIFAMTVQHKSFGFSSLPGASLIASLFINAKDGFVFVWKKIFNKKKSSAGYESYGSADE